MMHDYSRFTKRIAIKAPVNVIYEQWATQEGLERWFLRHAPYSPINKKPRGQNEYAAVHDTYEWRWHGWGDEAVEHGTVLEANGTDRFKFTFAKAGIVTISIRELDGQSICELLQDTIPTDEETKWNFFIGCQTGWTFYLTNLKSIVEGGLDLRNKDENLKGVVNS